MHSSRNVPPQHFKGYGLRFDWAIASCLLILSQSALDLLAFNSVLLHDIILTEL